MTCPSHSFDLASRTILREYGSLSSSLCSFLHSRVMSSHFVPNILLSTIFSNTLSLRSSPTVSDHVSHPYQWPCVSPISVTMCLTHTKQHQIILECILIFICLESKLEDKIFSTDWQEALPDIKLLLFSSPAFYFDSLRCSLIFYFFPPSKGTVINFYIVTSFCNLVFRHDHVLSFISVYF